MSVTVCQSIGVLSVDTQVTRSAKATSRCGLQSIPFQHLLLGLQQGYPLYSPYGCRCIIHLKHCPVEQKALPSQAACKTTLVSSGSHSNHFLFFSPPSGTFCTLDISLSRLVDIHTVDVCNTVRRMRAQRAFSIQTPEQYKFCYFAIIEYGLTTNQLGPVDFTGYSDSSSDSEWKVISPPDLLSFLSFLDTRGDPRSTFNKRLWPNYMALLTSDKESALTEAGKSALTSSVFHG